MKQIFETTYNGGLHQYDGYIDEIMLPMHDNVKLYTQICRKTKDQKGPVILIRNPYCKDQPMPEIFSGDWADWLEAGYIVISQHCRGTGRSEGAFTFYQQERNDGLYLLDWIRKQPFYNHEIFLRGGSYLSSVHFAWLNMAGEDIKGAVLPVQDCVRYNILYRNGFYKSGMHGSWMLSMYKKNMNITRNVTSDSFRTMPLTRFTENVFDENVPIIQEEFMHPRQDDPFWEKPEGGTDFTHALDHLDIPVLFITGFYDIYLEGVLKMWDSLSEKLREKSALVVTPYSHDFIGTQKVIEFKNGCLDTVWPHFEIDWCNAVREKRAPHFVTLGKTIFYSQFEEKWVTAPRLENGKKELCFHLGDHTLNETPVACEGIRYLYDPYNPASFKGGCCNTFGGQQIQDVPNSRYDIHSFISEPMKHPVRLRGTGKVVLQVSSDREDTCFYARLSHIHADGCCYCLRDDIVSLRNQVSDWQPGGKAEITLNFAANALLLRPGDRLRLDISSSSFPAYVPHRNTTENYWEAETALPAHNTVYPAESRLILYEIPD